MNRKLSDIRRLFKHSSHYLVADVLGMLASFISLPILTRVFSVGEYGTFGLVTATLFVLLAIAKFGAQYSAVRYYSEFTTKGDEGAATYYTTFLFQSVVFGCVTAFGFLLVNKIFPIFKHREFNQLLWFIALLSIMEALIIRLQNFIRAGQKTKLFGVISVLRRYGKLGAGLAFIFLISRRLSAFFGAHVLVDAAIVAALLLPLFRRRRIKWNSLSVPLLKKSASYGFPLVLLELSTLLFRFIDRFLVQAKLDATALGLYTLGANISQYTHDVIFMPLSMALFPIYMEMWTVKGKESVEAFLSKVANYLLMFCIPIVFGLSLLSKPLVVFLASDKFSASSGVVPLILTGTFVWGIHHVLAAGLYIYNKTKALALVIFASCCLNAVLNMVLIPGLGITGAAISTLLSCLVMTVCVVTMASKNVRIRFDLLSALKYVLASLGMCFVISIPHFAQRLHFLLFAVLAGPPVYFLLLVTIDDKARRLALTLSRAMAAALQKRSDAKVPDGA